MRTFFYCEYQIFVYVMYSFENYFKIFLKIIAKKLAQENNYAYLCKVIKLFHLL